MQADRICHELFEQFSDNLFSRIEFHQFDKEEDEESDFAFTLLLKKEQLAQELEKNGELFSISNAFIAQEKISFFVLFINSEEKKLFEKSKSFFDKLFEQLFEYLQKEYLAENTYFYNGSITSIIARDSVDSLVTEISRRCCQANDFSLYDNINLSLKNIFGELAATTYEKNITEGIIYFVDSIDKVDFQFEFKNYEEYGNFDLNNIRLLRKLLELSNMKSGVGIISDTNVIYGIGSVKDEQDYYSVVFDDDRKWTIFENNNELISIRNNRLVFVNSLITKREFTSYITKIFPEKKDTEEVGMMYGIVKSLIKQRKGTILVIKKNAEDFIQKYQDLCMVIKPVKLDEKNVEKLSSIDGAIIIDENCMCYGFGAVLDGLDTGCGNRGRGSRYNSSERFYNLYKNESNTELMVFILSDDGNYNFFPEQE